ncbi:D-alanyl-D-alanine carboxypeptidase family protein [Aneurinibacillus aneurinilyticus]|nr:D-alanyl-D-alanine carboxypeptidase family protein [Aneurinibacillus aneurinilyticus]MED0708215.1 D-alanyl-D-alanine carboxypeptidase [Aneurinibacillus aneurinilyticus]MED0721432.1 D-alanyl-D-alanine carboxypeptidase [Aneurinibacillus aneurinilyticus]MED0734100.1 D-alanyl-D-alanine carboxypeptidase [Aneurinibacillus aneurinilyticus]MED0743227.1 D-alanyl-D-alanine carboxypeptidase [Aneurinibacillus aneurinilyticus]
MSTLLVRQMKKPIMLALAFLVFFVPILLTVNTGQAQAAAPVLNLDVRSAIMIEAKTGKILYKYNENQAFPPASMTKMMTEYLVLDAIQKKKLSWDQKVTVDEYGAFLGKSKTSGVLLALNEVHTVKELYDAMAIYSANDATVMLAKTVAGSESEFIKLMNKTAKEFGMTQTYFATSTGLPLADLKQFASESATGENMMSARDSAILAKELLTRYPELLETTKIPHKTFREGTSRPLKMDNWNWMLPGLVKQYAGVDGLKTGHTNAAGFCFTGTGERNGVRLITVVMGAKSFLSRFTETSKMLDYGFTNYKMQPLLKKGAQVPGGEMAKVDRGTDKEVAALASQDVLYPVKAGEEGVYKPKAVVKQVTAPIKQGQEVGSIKIVGSNGKADEFLRPIDEQKAGGTLVAKDEVEEVGWIRLAFRSFFGFIGDIFSGLGNMIKGLFS